MFYETHRIWSGIFIDCQFPLFSQPVAVDIRRHRKCGTWFHQRIRTREAFIHLRYAVPTFTQADKWYCSWKEIWNERRFQIKACCHDPFPLSWKFINGRKHVRHQAYKPFLELFFPQEKLSATGRASNTTPYLIYYGPGAWMASVQYNYSDLWGDKEMAIVPRPQPLQIHATYLDYKIIFCRGTPFKLFG